MGRAEELASRIGPDMWAVACSVGSEPVDAIELTTLASPALERASFRLAYSDGRLCKIRRMQSVGAARRVRELRTLVDGAHMPVLLGAQGAVLLTEWSEGSAPKPFEGESLTAAGELLGRLHATPVPEELIRAYGFPPDGWPGRLEANLRVLVDAGALSVKSAGLASECARRTAPPEVRRALVHCDFCPENLVVGSQGHLELIDNENLTVDALAFDLARTWYRWPFAPSTVTPFWAGYRRSSDPSPFLDHKEHWLVQALSEAAAFRVAGRTANPEVPVAALERLLAGPGFEHGPA